MIFVSGRIHGQSATRDECRNTAPPDAVQYTGKAASPSSDGSVKTGGGREKATNPPPSIAIWPPRLCLPGPAGSPPASCRVSAVPEGRHSSDMTVQEARSKNHVVRLEPFFRKSVVAPRIRLLSSVPTRQLPRISPQPAWKPPTLPSSRRTAWWRWPWSSWSA